MKARMTLKSMLLATLCCVIITAVDLLTGTNWDSPRDFETILYWIIVTIGWIVYFLEQLRNTKQDT